MINQTMQLPKVLSKTKTFWSIYSGFNGNPYALASNSNGTGKIKTRLDGKLVNSRWFLSYPDSSLSHISQTGSYHTPIIK